MLKRLNKKYLNGNHK